MRPRKTKIHCTLKFRIHDSHCTLSLQKTERGRINTLFPAAREETSIVGVLKAELKHDHESTLWVGIDHFHPLSVPSAVYYPVYRIRGPLDRNDPLQGARNAMRPCTCHTAPGAHAIPCWLSHHSQRLLVHRVPITIDSLGTEYITEY